VDARVLELEGLSALGKPSEHFGTGLPIQGGDGLSAGKFHANQAVVEAEFNYDPGANKLYEIKNRAKRPEDGREARGIFESVLSRIT